MIVVKNTSGEVLSMWTKELSPLMYKGKTIYRELLDGTYHVQSIGEAGKSIKIKIFADRQQAERVNAIQSQGEHFVMQINKINTRFFLASPISWRLEIRGESPIYSGEGLFLYRGYYN